MRRGDDGGEPAPAHPRTITLTIGLPGAGQEAWVDAAERAGAVVVDRRALRRFLGSDEGDDALFRELVKFHVRRSDRDVIIHDLHVHKRDRVHMIQTIRCSDVTPHYRLVGALFTATLITCAQRLHRAGTPIPAETLAAYAAALAAHDPRRETAFDDVLTIPA